MSFQPVCISYTDTFYVIGDAIALVIGLQLCSYCEISEPSVVFDLWRVIDSFFL